MKSTKTAVVIGASSGMGREIAIKLAQDGFKMGITGRRRELLDELRAQSPENFLVSCFDCTEMRNTAKLEALRDRLGHIDLLFLSSGNGEINKELDFEIENATNELNVMAFTEITSWGFNYFKKRGKGHLAVITSIAGIRGGRVAPAYNASKAYQLHYLEGLRQRAKRLKIAVYITDIRPGFVDTSMAKGGGKFWVVPLKKAARIIYRDLQQKKAISYVSRRWRLIAWVLKLIPPNIYKRM